MNRNFTALVVGTLMLAIATASQAALVSTGLQLAQGGGTFDVGNIAIGKTAFAPNIEGQDGGTPTQPTGYGGVHTTTGVNNGVYGNNGAWLAGSPNSFVGLNLGGSFSIASIAYGRDNNGGFGDRQLGLVTLQFTQVVSPGVGTADTGNAATGWQTIGTTDYTGAGIDFHQADRHRFNFAPVNATGVRLVTANSGRGIDEIELYNAHASALTLVSVGTHNVANVVPDNLALASRGSIAFAKDVIPGFPGRHEIPHINNGAYGNSDSWLANSPESFIGVAFNGVHTIGSVAWGRDNGGNESPDGAPANQEFLDRDAGEYRLQGTLAANPNALTPDNLWFDIGTVSVSDTDPTAHLRHLYSFNPVAVTGLRLLALTQPGQGLIAIDEFEAFAIPEPASATLAMFGLAGLAMRRRRAA